MRKRIILIVCLIVFLLPQPAFANGGPGEGYALLIGGNIQFKNTPDIFVAKEDLNIVLSPRTSIVTAVYTLKNTGPARDLTYIFPITRYASEYYGEGNVEWLTFYDGEKRLGYTNIDQQTPENPEEGDCYTDKTAIVNGQEVDYSYIKNSYYQTDLSFAAGETKVLTVTYEANNSFESGGMGYFSDVTFLYDLSPAAAWGNGMAGEFNLSIDYNALHFAKDIDINMGGFTREPAGVFRYSATNFDFAKQGFISALFKYPFYMEELEAYNKDSDWLSKVYVSSTLKSPTDAYSAKNLFDGDPETAWSSDGKGVGKSIELMFDQGVTIGILNGFIKNENTYYDNCRIKKLKLESWFIDESPLDYPSVYEIDFEDIPYSDIDKNNLFNNLTLFATDDWPSDFMRLTVLEVYPGRKNNNLCLSEIFMFSQYDPDDYPEGEYALSPVSIYDDFADIMKLTRQGGLFSPDSGEAAEEPPAPVVPASDIASPAPDAPVNNLPYVDTTVMVVTNAALAFTLCIVAVIYLAKKKKEHE